MTPERELTELKSARRDAMNLGAPASLPASYGPFCGLASRMPTLPESRFMGFLRHRG